MCIRDREGNRARVIDFGLAKWIAREDEGRPVGKALTQTGAMVGTMAYICLLYTSDAADERSSVDLGGRRLIKKQTNTTHTHNNTNTRDKDYTRTNKITRNIEQHRHKHKKNSRCNQYRQQTQ
mgnify:CR=1 FL=1